MSICLSMIVKNEGKIIERLLLSVYNFIDTYCICDTGSTDETISIIESFFKKYPKSGKIISEPFINFEYNRNFLLNSSYGMSKFLLLLDADMVFYTEDSFKEELEPNTCYQIYQGGNDFYYYNTRIIPNKKGLYYIGETHEYLYIPKEYRKKIIPKDKVFIKDIGDGGSKKDKFQRDISLLKKSLEKNPKQSRNTFYLANSYFDSNDYKNALQYYFKRIQLGEWQEEIWFSYFRLGKIYKYYNEINTAISYFLKAIEFSPYRIENIYEIIKYYREKKDYKIAFSFYQMALSMMDKKKYTNCLFFYNDIYEYKLDFEYCIIAYYNNIKNIDNKMISIMNKVDFYHSFLISNLKYYYPIFNFFSLKKKFSETIIKTYNNEQYKFYSSSSSLLLFPEYNVLLVRYVNYYILENGKYQYYNNNIISIYKLYQFSKDWKVVHSLWLDNISNFDRFYIGIEDIRLFSYDSSIKIIGTNIDKNIRICSGILDSEYKFQYSILESDFLLNDCEKNWVYTEYKNKLCIIYKWFPLTICSLHENKISKILEVELPLYFKDIRGSSCGFFYENEVWFIVHLVDTTSIPRYYYHSILVFNQDYSLERYTRYFKLTEKPIEYSLSISIEDNYIIIPISSMDRTTEVFFFEKSKLENTFFKHKN